MKCSNYVYGKAEMRNYPITLFIGIEFLLRVFLRMLWKYFLVTLD